MYYIPAMIGYNYDFEVVTLITPIGIHLAPTLNPQFIYELEDGDALIALVEVNMDNQNIEGFITVKDVILFYKLDKFFPQATEGGKSAGEDFNFSIDDFYPVSFFIDKHFNNYVAIFEFVKHVHRSNSFMYEMTYDPDDTDEIPSVYFRAKNVPDGVYQIENGQYLCAFDFADFFAERRDSGNKFEVNFFFKTGEEGEKEIFEPFEENPVEIYK